MAENTSLNLLNGSNSTISASNLANNSKINVTTTTQTATMLTINTMGAASFNKVGEGLLKLSGNLQHTGVTNFSGGEVEFNGNLTSSHLSLEENTTLGGNATISGQSTWKNGSHIQPGVNQSNSNFAERVMSFANIMNEGADVLLRVKNDNSHIQSWEHDQLLISGNVHSESPIPVDVQFLGTSQSNSDENKNGKYDPDEGISLVQVLGEGRVSQFTLGRKLDAHKQATDLYQYTLVSVDKPISVSSENKFGHTGKFFDYRLQTLLVDEQGNSPEPVIRSFTQKGASVAIDDEQPLSVEEYINLALSEKARVEQERDAALADKVNAEKAVQDALADKAKAEKAKQDALADKVNAEKTVQDALADKAKAEKAKQDALADKAKAEKTAQDALADKANAEKTTQDLVEEIQRNYRVALNQKIPSLLIANTAIFNQGDNVRRQFMDSLWSQDKKGFYVNQQHGNSIYVSDLGFLEYGYNYKAKQSSTLFGGFIPLSENTELHTAIGFNTQTVTPDAADGASKTKYKSTSLLAGLHQKWENLILNTSLGYHLHKGEISTPQELNTAKIEAKQLQVTGEVGYEIPVGNINLVPVLGLSYQQVTSKLQDVTTKWDVDLGNYAVFSQYAGLNVVWKNDVIRLSAGSFFENNESDSKSVNIRTGQQSSEFKTGNVGNTLLLKLNSEFALTKQLGLGIRFEHRHALSDAKLKQTQIGAKLEYKF
ncbi:autotransporter outer membrane beta-barrel domain-containing protein [Ursidibacter sp. B-7004-1]